MLRYYVQTPVKTLITGLSTDQKPMNPNPQWAFMEIDGKKQFYNVVNGKWKAVPNELMTIFASQYCMDEKQDTLISGENIKTINGESLLGSGDLEISTSANALIQPFTAGATINGQRLVMMSAGKVVHYQPTEDNYNQIVGISRTAALENEQVDIILDGIITSSGWGLTPNAIYYAATDGMITSSPTAEVQTIIGTATDENTLNINITESIITI